MDEAERPSLSGRTALPIVLGSAHRSAMVELSRSPATTVVIPGGGGWRWWRRDWLRSSLATRENLFVSRRDPIASVLWVEDGSLRLRRWLPRLLAADGIRRIRCVGIVDVSVPWYAGIAFSATELGEALESAAAETSRRVDRSTRAMAAWLARRGVPAVAETHVGPFAETVLARARETSADLILVHDDGRRRAALREIVGHTESSVLVVRDGASGLRPS